MAIAKVIRVSREWGNYSTCMGAYDLHPEDEQGLEDKQFWGRIVATLSGPRRGWYAVLHKFDAWGYHVGTDHWFAGFETPGSYPRLIKRANTKLDKMVAALGKIEYADIQIRLFKVEIDGTIFGLVNASQPGEGPAFAEQVAMEPGNLLFRAPLGRQLQQLKTRSKGHPEFRAN
jgi:hypothetical protein